MSEDKARGRAEMPSTHWSLIGRIQAGSTGVRRRALEELLPNYLPALRAHLLWNRRLDHHFAEDVLQSFLTNKVLERELIATADQRLGKFRTLLLRALDNFTIDELRKRRSDHRSGGGQAMDLDVADCAPGTAPERMADAFELAWSQRVLVESLERMRRDCHQTGHEVTWSVFEDRVIRPALEPTARPTPYEQLLEQYGLESPQQAANLLANAKRRFRRHLEATIAEYAAPGEVAIEIAQLREIAAARGGQRLDMRQIMEAGHPDASLDGAFDLINPARFPDAFSEDPLNNLWLESELGAILRQQLDLPVTEIVPDLEASEIPFEGVTLRQFLLHERPPVEGLRRLKEYARYCAREPSHGRLIPEIASVVYCASIAAALDRHHARITKSSDDVLRMSFGMVSRTTWVPGEVRELVEGAVSLLK